MASFGPKLFFISLLKQAYNKKTNLLIVPHLVGILFPFLLRAHQKLCQAWEDRDISQWIITLILETFPRCNPEHLENLVDALECLINIEDKYQAWYFDYSIHLFAED